MLTNIKYLFLIDGIGALISAFLLGIVLPYFQYFFWIPSSTLFFLAALPVGFAIYDYLCYINSDIDIKKSLKNIAFINFSYCVVSIILALCHICVITIYGWTYIIIEIIIVIGIATIELKAAHNYIK